MMTNTQLFSTYDPEILSGRLSRWWQRNVTEIFSTSETPLYEKALQDSAFQDYQKWREQLTPGNRQKLFKAFEADQEAAEKHFHYDLIWHVIQLSVWQVKKKDIRRLFADYKNVIDKKLYEETVRLISKFFKEAKKYFNSDFALAFLPNKMVKKVLQSIDGIFAQPRVDEEEKSAAKEKVVDETKKLIQTKTKVQRRSASSTMTATAAASIAGMALSAAQPSAAQPIPSAYFKTIGGSDLDAGHSMSPAANGDSLIIGKTFSFGAGDADIALSRIGVDGILKWFVTIGGVLDEHGRAVLETPDGGYILTGYTRSGGSGGNDFFVIKLDRNRTVTWAKTFGDASNNEEGDSLLLMPDGSYLASGHTWSFGAGQSDSCFIKFDRNGTLDSAKTYGGLGQDRIFSTILTTDGGWLVTGYTESYGAGFADLFFMKFAFDGSLIVAKALGGADADRGYSVKTTADGGFAIAGLTRSVGAGSWDVFLTRFAADSSLVFAEAIGSLQADEGLGLQIAPNDDIIITGYTEILGHRDCILIRLDKNGTMIRAKAFGGGNTDLCGYSSVQLDSNGNVRIAGSTTSFGAGNTDAFVMQLDFEDNISGCPFIRDITANLTVTPISPTITPFSPTIGNIVPTIMDWNVTAVSQTPAVQTYCEAFPTSSSSSTSSITSSSREILSTLGFTGISQSRRITTNPSSFFNSRTSVLLGSSAPNQASSSIAAITSNTGSMATTGSGIGLISMLLMIGGPTLAVLLLVFLIVFGLRRRNYRENVAREKHQLEMGETPSVLLSTRPQSEVHQNQYGPVSEVSVSLEGTEYANSPTSRQSEYRKAPGRASTTDFSSEYANRPTDVSGEPDLEGYYGSLAEANELAVQQGLTSPSSSPESSASSGLRNSPTGSGY